MKKFISVLLIIFVVLSFSACSDNAGKNDGKENITVCLDWTPNTNHTGIYAALLNGYYEEAGLDVEIVQPPEDGATLMCASGQAQFAIDFQDYLAPVFASDMPLDVTAVAAVVNHNTSGIISRKGEGIHTPKGLEGKRYSTWNLPTEQAIIKSVMESDGGDFNKVNLIPNNITDEALALKENQTDAVWIYYGWSGINAEESELDFDYWNFTDINPVFDFYTPVIVANNSYLKENPETARAFIQATKKGYEFAVQNPEEAAMLLVEGDETGSLKGNEEFVIKSQKWISERYIADGDSWGYIDAERWNGFFDWLWDNKLIDSKIAENYGFTNELLK